MVVIIVNYLIMCKHYVSVGNGLLLKNKTNIKGVIFILLYIRTIIFNLQSRSIINEN